MRRGRHNVFRQSDLDEQSDLYGRIAQLLWNPKDLLSIVPNASVRADDSG